MNAFKRVRLHLGYTQVEAAAILGVTQSNVSKLERGNRFSLTHLKVLAEHNGVEVRIHVGDLKIEV